MSCEPGLLPSCDFLSSTSFPDAMKMSQGLYQQVLLVLHCGSLDVLDPGIGLAKKSVWVFP